MGASIVSFGSYRYRYDTGREGNFLLTGFSPTKANTTVYAMPGYQDLSEELAKLGKHKIGAGCLSINKLADVDLDVLERIVAYGVEHMRANFETADSFPTTIRHDHRADRETGQRSRGGSQASGNHFSTATS